jgi:hypothetical protein
MSESKLNPLRRRSYICSCLFIETRWLLRVLDLLQVGLRRNMVHRLDGQNHQKRPSRLSMSATAI